MSIITLNFYPKKKKKSFIKLDMFFDYLKKKRSKKINNKILKLLESIIRVSRSVLLKDFYLVYRTRVNFKYNQYRLLADRKESL